jgi:hypothetical protein
MSSSDAFNRLHFAFEQNNFRCQVFELTLVDGSRTTGVPTLGSFVNRFDPDVAFTFDPGGGSPKRSIRFRDIAAARPIDA